MTSSPSAPPTAPGLSAPDIEAMVLHELRRVFRVVVRIRIIGVVFMSTLAVLFGVYDPVWWKVALPAAAAVFIGVVVFFDWRRGDLVDITPTVIVRVLWLAIFGQLLMILLTGGIRSPLVVLLPPMAMVMATATGSPKHFIVGMSIPLAVLYVLFALDITGAADSLVPPVLGRGEPAYAWLVVIAITAMAIASGVMALYSRGAFKGMATRAAYASAEAAETMRERNRELVALSGALAHELKNPLASIQGLAKLLDRKLPDGSQEQERMGVLLAEVRRMGGILEEFLNFSRPASGLAEQQVSGERIVRDMVTLHEQVARDRRCSLEASIATDRAIHCDPRKVKQVLVNLIHNALDAVNPGGRVVVEVRDAAEPAGGLVFQVSDDGPGLAPEIRERLFTVGATTKPQGSGLGLVIARSIAEQHGGTLEIAGRQRGGCRATLTLPERRNEVTE